jgi:hypothetical protein
MALGMISQADEILCVLTRAAECVVAERQKGACRLLRSAFALVAKVPVAADKPRLTREPNSDEA